MQHTHHANDNNENPLAFPSGMGRRVRRACRAFTMIELMIVVLIIGVLLNISVPAFIRARESARSKSCIKNLKTIDSAKEQYAMDNKVNSTYTPLSTDLYGTSSYVRSTPACPTVGTTGYTINAIGTLPSCSVGANLNSGTWDDHIMTQ